MSHRGIECKSSHLWIWGSMYPKLLTLNSGFSPTTSSVPPLRRTQEFARIPGFWYFNTVDNSCHTSGDTSKEMGQEAALGGKRAGKCTSWVAEHAECQKDLGEMILGTKQYQPWQQLSSKRLLHVITTKSPPRNYPLSPNNISTNPVHLSHQCIPFLLTTGHSVVPETAGEKE